MELRILKKDELLEMRKKNYIFSQYSLANDESENILCIGAFQEQIIGLIELFDFHRIVNFWIDDKCDENEIGLQLLKQAISLTMDDLYVEFSSVWVNLFLLAGFRYVDSSKQELVYHHFVKECFTKYEQVQDFIASQKQRVYALDNFRRFMSDMGNPQILLNTIHIGGTNGKGSTTNYIRSVLQEAGYKVATFTSPVLVTRLEIMRINNEHIQENEIIQYANRYMDLWLKYELSMFEIEVFIAIMFFIRHHVDYAIFEVGLGGELDATNIVFPIICANTNIGMDHTEFLGDTYEKIAYTKAGIIKDGVPFVTGEKKLSCLEVFRQVCQHHHSQLIQVRDLFHVQDHGSYLSYDYRNYHIVLHTSAIYQCQNSALALEILLYLRDNHYLTFDDQQLQNGLANATWAGRFEVLCHHPLIIIDGAHNKEGMEAFYQSARKYSNIKIIFSALKDKDTHAMMELLLKLTDDITVCEFDFYRAQKAEKLAENFPVKIQRDWHQAIDQAFKHDGVVFITGSLYFLAQVRPYILEYQNLMK